MKKSNKFDTFSPEVRKAVYNATSGYCWREGCTEKIHSFHHRLKNNRYNRERFPLFIQSIFNCVGLCYGDHRDHSAEWDITEKQAEAYENYLKKINRN